MLSTPDCRFLRAQGRCTRRCRPADSANLRRPLNGSPPERHLPISAFASRLCLSPLPLPRPRTLHTRTAWRILAASPFIAL